MKEFVSDLRPYLRERVSLAPLVCFRTGGIADYLFEPDSPDILALGLKEFTRLDIPVYVIGEGSNLLVHDGGFRGVVIRLLRGCFVELNAIENGLIAGSGVTLKSLSGFALSRGQKGFEFMGLIPGTVGGAISGNAGREDCSTGALLQEVSVISRSGQFRCFERKSFDYGYRSFPLLEDWIIIRARFDPCGSDTGSRIKASVREISSSAHSTQPKGRSCGSIFKNTPELPAWKIIDSLGYRGFRLGGAEVSGQHPNWIINRNHASSLDIWNCICRIREEAFRKMGVRLELEIRLLGNFQDG